MSILKYRTSDGQMMPVGLPPGIIDWKNIVNKPLFVGNSELSTDVDVITLAPGNKASATLIRNEETNQFELSLFIPRGADGAGGSGGDGTGTGADGYSPTIQVKEITGGYAITVVNKDGLETFNLYNGVSPYQIASEHGYDGEESDFNKLLGSLNSLNFVAQSAVKTTLNDTDTEIPTSSAVIDYLSKELIILTAKFIESPDVGIEVSESGDDIDSNETEASSVKVRLTEDASQLFNSYAPAGKPMFLILEGMDYLFHYVGNRTFFGNISGLFVTLTFSEESFEAELEIIPHLYKTDLIDKLTEDTDSGLPTAKAVTSFVKAHVTNTLEATSELPVNSSAVITYLKENPELIVLKGESSYDELTGTRTVQLTTDYEIFSNNIETDKPLFLHLTDLDICLTYVGSYTFTGFYRSDFISVAFDSETLEGEYNIQSYIPAYKKTSTFDSVDKTTIPTVQAILDYLPTQVASQITSTEILPPSAKAVADFVEAANQVCIIKANKTESTDGVIALTISKDDFNVLQSDSITGKAVLLVVQDTNIILAYEGNNTFSGTVNNKLAYVQFSATILTKELLFFDVLTSDHLATDINSSGETIPTLQILKTYVDTHGGLTLTVVTQQADGLMSKEDKAKLDSIAPGANKYEHPQTHPISIISGLSKELSDINNSLNDLSENKVSSSQIGKASGVAALDDTGKVPLYQLPEILTSSITEGYYNEIDGLFYEDISYTKPCETITGNYYVDKLTKETFRYSGSTYVSLTPSGTANIRPLTMEELTEIINLRA